MNAARTIVAAATFEPTPGADVASRESRLAWVRVCVAPWFSWRRDALNRADARFVAALRAGTSDSERAEAAGASAEAWIALLEAMVRVTNGVEPAEVRSDPELHATYRDAMLDQARKLAERNLAPVLRRCSAFTASTKEARRGCVHAEVRMLALVAGTDARAGHR